MVIFEWYRNFVQYEDCLICLSSSVKKVEKLTDGLTYTFEILLRFIHFLDMCFILWLKLIKEIGNLIFCCMGSRENYFESVGKIMIIILSFRVFTSKVNISTIELKKLAVFGLLI